jgi:hypothetical protein
MSTEIDDLHEVAFGFRPPKKGAAGERLAAVVLTVLGWKDVVHDTEQDIDGRRAEHQLDVTARHPDGRIARLLVECKGWNCTVGKRTLDTLVGVRGQIGADAAAVATTKGYTKGAIDVAVDEIIAILPLRAFDQGNPDPYVNTITLTIRAFGSKHSNFDVELMTDYGLERGKEFQVHLAGEDRLLRLDGSPAETITEVLRGNAAPMEEGIFQQRVLRDRVCARVLSAHWRRGHTNFSEPMRPSDSAMALVGAYGWVVTSRLTMTANLKKCGYSTVKRSKSSSVV